MISDEAKVGESFADDVSQVACKWPFLNRSYKIGTATRVERWETCKDIYPQILHLMQIRKDLGALETIDQADSKLIELLLEACQYCVECGASHEAVPLLDYVEELYTLHGAAAPIEDEEMVKLYRGRIAVAASTKQPGDLFHFSQLAWDIERTQCQKIGHPTPMLAVAFNDLAVAWACQREWTKSIEYLEESKKIREQLPGFTRDQLWSPLYHLGLVFHHQGKYDEAESILNEAIKDRQEAYGPDDAVSIRSAALLYARGNVRLSRGNEALNDIQNSLQDHIEAESRARRSVGAHNRITLIFQYQLARVRAHIGDYKTACDLLEQIQEHSIDKPIYDREIARTSYLYYQCLKIQGRNIEATEELQRALGIHNRLRPQEQRTAETMTEEDISKLIPYDWL